MSQASWGHDTGWLVGKLTGAENWLGLIRVMKCDIHWRKQGQAQLHSAAAAMPFRQKTPW